MQLAFHVNATAIRHHVVGALRFEGVFGRDHRNQSLGNKKAMRENAWLTSNSSLPTAALPASGLKGLRRSAPNSQPMAPPLSFADYNPSARSQRAIVRPRRNGVS